MEHKGPITLAETAELVHSKHIAHGAPPMGSERDMHGLSGLACGFCRWRSGHVHGFCGEYAYDEWGTHMGCRGK